MPGFTESSITLNFPDHNFFRFSTCRGYMSLSGNHFKEMDACWYNGVDNFYWLIELKDYSLASIATAETIEQKAWDMVKKAVDSFTMFLSSKHGYVYAANLDPCFPRVPDANTEFKFINIVHCDTSQIADVQLLHNSFRSKFKPYADLFGINHYAVVEHSRAMRIIPDNIVQ